jgi:hypothetical protein
MVIPPPDLLLEGQALGAQGKLYAGDTGDGSLDRTLLDLQLTPGPPSGTIATIVNSPQR